MTYPKNIHQAYHAHVYYDEHNQDIARGIVEHCGNHFQVNVGRFHLKLVGPHPKWSCQLAFNQSEFDQIIPWLEEHRQGLTVFVHGVTGDDIVDHTDYAYWLGEPVELNLHFFGVQ